MPYSKFSCNWYPEDTLCATIKGQLEIEGDIFVVSPCISDSINLLHTYECTVIL